MNGAALCRRDAEQLLVLIRRCIGMDGDLEAAVARRGRHGETVARSTAPGLPVNFDAADARRELGGALNDAVGRLLGAFPRLTVSGAAVLLSGHERALRGSWAAPVLLGDLTPLVPRAVAHTDKPRGRLTVNVKCPRCGAGPLRPVGGTLECTSCRERMSVAEVRHAAA
ncbi:hypothetical protein GCM10009592_14380 [Brachybacterium rhamnosum]|uniref:Uncharacterized protein n=1 Tax=Brachybacterium rhamnosum TaxID=173361 RepID=A0ABW4PY86_9MICO